MVSKFSYFYVILSILIRVVPFCKRWRRVRGEAEDSFPKFALVTQADDGNVWSQK